MNKTDIKETLLKIQQNLIAPKDAYNSFARYNYRSAESILQAVKPLLEETSSILVISDSIEAHGERIYIKATATLSNGEQSISASAFAREPKDKKGADDSQITGAASSYARKYALCGLFAIDDNKDADATNTHGKAILKEQETEPFDVLIAINAMYDAPDFETVQSHFGAAYVQLPDGAERKKLTNIYNQIKASYQQQGAV